MRLLMNRFLKYLLFIMFLNSSFSMAGGITVGATRVIYDSDKREALISVNNSDITPYLIQSWVELDEEKKDKAPFIITPPLFRLDGNAENILRIVKTNEDLPDNKESLFWINIKAIPSSTRNNEQNTLQIAIRTKIKLIYRPSSITGNPLDKAKELTWKQVGNKLTITNPTPYILNFETIKVGQHSIENPLFIMPYSQETYNLPNGVNGNVSWSIINDFGGVSELLTSNK
ncbi:fimbria/pilus periplasmic chaperone [Providencia rettgeri]|nr:fimbria/pilus periplasmic chaperone [Providencia rettgeri]ELR5167423.1 fimbria/pilus periplasmic chaperone [Providencia rettgeri]